MSTALEVRKSRVPSKTSSSSKTRRKNRKSSKKHWFIHKSHSGWKKNQPAGVRRKLVLQASGGDLLAAARSKQALANVSQDPKTKEVATKDAKYFFREYHKEKAS